MDLMHTCPCCGNFLLRHLRSQGIYWFCPHCYQEMPILEEHPHPWKDRVVIIGQPPVKPAPQKLKQSVGF